MRSRSTLLLTVTLGFGAPLLARAEPPLPYTQRTHGYSAWDTSVRGDLRTVGMAGAMVGLADSRMGSVDNPAGLPVTLDSSGIQFTGNSIQDGYIQSYPTMIRTGNAVFTWCDYPWAVSFASYAPQAEGDTYQVGAGRVAQLSVSTQEYHLSGAEVFLSDRLSLGATLILGHNVQSITPVGGAEISHSAWGLGVGLGALYQLPGRWLIGLSYTPPIHYAMADFADSSSVVGSFFQPADAPYRLGVGMGWVPNRIFSASAGLYVFGSTPGAALLSDDTRIVGDSMTFQPRFGVSYLLAEYKEFKIELAAGTYMESMRIANAAERWHATGAVEFKPWFFNIGWGLDEARQYQNFIYTFGVDVGKILRKLDLIPQAKHYPYAGFLPNPTHSSEEGLPRALVRDYKDKSGPNVWEVGKLWPEKLRDHFLNAPMEVKNFGVELFDTIGNLPATLQQEGAVILNGRMPEETPRLLMPDITH